jgi:hypothetical protein
VKDLVKATVLALSVLAASTLAAPLSAAPKDPETRAWWALIAALSSDTMRGRDTGSAEHRRAAEMVVDRLKAAGLMPMGDSGGWLQNVPLHEVRVETEGTRFALAGGGTSTTLRFLDDITIRASATLPDQIDTPMVFRGYCADAEIGTNIAGKVVVCFGARRKTMGSDDARIAAATAAGAAGIIIVDDVGFTVEPPRWPAAYARTVTLRDGKTPAPAAATLPVMRLNPDALEAVLAGSGHDAATIIADTVAARPLPSFDLTRRLKAEFTTSTRDFASENVLALLPGSDPTLAKQIVVIDAHLDGYGIGAPVNGDSLYNGAFDDAAYVATLVRLADVRAGKGFRRPVLFAVFTGEEKGLLGSRWFVDHPTVPKADMVANITLDAIRPLFPLKILTLIGSDRSSLKTNVERVAGPMGVAIRPDLEPERGMIRRTDAASFLAAGIPGVAFMFGYDNGSKEEAKFRNWYRTRYHKPQDDISQPIDFTAAADFNRLFGRLVEDVANTDGVPTMSKVQ